jgi:hypothetical protein
VTRTVVYARPRVADASVRGRVPAGAGARGSLEAEESEAPQRSTASPTPADGYVDKLIKYVPAEVVAVFAPLSAGLASRQGLLIFLSVVCLVATPGYLFLTAQHKPAELRPLPHYYVLAAIAFAAWALGVSSGLDAVFALDAVTVGVILGASVLLIPLADSLLARANI